MRISNNKQTTFGMKDVIIMADQSNRGYARLERLVGEVRPQLMEKGNPYTYLLVGNGAGWGDLKTCAVSGVQHVKSREIATISGIAQGRSFFGRAAKLCNLADAAVFQSDLTLLMYSKMLGIVPNGLELTREQLAAIYKKSIASVKAIARIIDDQRFRDTVIAGLTDTARTARRV